MLQSLYGSWDFQNRSNYAPPAMVKLLTYQFDYRELYSDKNRGLYVPILSSY